MELLLDIGLNELVEGEDQGVLLQSLEIEDCFFYWALQ